MDAGGIYIYCRYTFVCLFLWSKAFVTHLLFFSIMQNDISDVLDLTFSVDADEEKLILYEKTEVTTITCSAFFNCVFEMKFV